MEAFGGSSQDADVSPVAKFQDRYTRWERLLHRLAFSTVEAHIALRAWRWSWKCVRSSHSHSRVAKKLSAMALSKQSPTEPIDGATLHRRQRSPKG